MFAVIGYSRNLFGSYNNLLLMVMTKLFVKERNHGVLPDVTPPL